MTPIEEYFGGNIIVINREKRTDRLAFVRKEFEQLGITHWQRFSAIDLPRDENRGCNESHAAVLRMVIENEWRNALILEDDFQCRFPNTQELFANMIKEVPADAFMIYLSGHYAEKPKYRVSEHVIRMGHMKTTSSYGVTLEAAREMEPFIHGIGPIDELYHQFHEHKPCYIFQPRLIVQRAGFSDLQQMEMSNEGCMTDENHERMV